MSIQGKTAVAGAPATDTSPGTAYVYSDGASGWPMSPTNTLSDPAADASDSYGFVAVWKKIAVVGAPGTDSNDGAAYIYKV